MVDETNGPANASNEVPIPGQNAGAPLDFAPQKTEGAPASALPEHTDAPMRDDIAKILKEVKLPERREFRASADTRIPPVDASIQPKEEVVPPAPAAEKPAPHYDNDSVVAMHTLKQDLQHVVLDQKISVVRAVSLEEDKKRSRPIDDTIVPSSPGHRTAITAGIVLLFLGGAALLGVYLVAAQNASPLPRQASDSLVFAEQNVVFPIGGKAASGIKNELAQARSNSNASLGSITRVIPVVPAGGTDGTTGQRPATLSEFFAALGTHAPDALVRALGDTFFFGIHTVDKNAPVFVLTVTSYDNAFAGMLAWEKTMNVDLSPAFTPVAALTNDKNGLPTDRTFTDIVMRNYDVRALKDDSGTIQLYYSFPTRDILVIGESPYTFTEILGRLQAGRHL